MEKNYLGQTEEYQEPSKLEQVMKAIGNRMLRASAAGGSSSAYNMLPEQVANKEKEFGLKSRELDIQEQRNKTDAEMKRVLYANKVQKQNPQLEQEFRNELKPYTKTMMEVDAAYRKIKSTEKNPSPAGDLSLVFNYMKMLDPGSTVREGEFATAQNTVGVPDRIRNMYNKVTSGERLAPNQRLDFVNQAKNTYDAQYESYNNLVKPYKKVTEQSGGNFENVNLYQSILDNNSLSNTGQNMSNAGNKPKTVIQNGIQYTLNEETGQYE